jgi:hypothetical protein
MSLDLLSVREDNGIEHELSDGRKCRSAPDNDHRLMIAALAAVLQANSVAITTNMITAIRIQCLRCI